MSDEKKLQRYDLGDPSGGEYYYTWDDMLDKSDDGDLVLYDEAQASIEQWQGVALEAVAKNAIIKKELAVLRKIHEDHVVAFASERERAKVLIEFIEEVRDTCDSTDSWYILIPVAIKVLAEYNESEEEAQNDGK